MQTVKKDTKKRGKSQMVSISVKFYAVNKRRAA